MKAFHLQSLSLLSTCGIFIFLHCIVEDIFAAFANWDNKMNSFLSMCGRGRTFVLDTWSLPDAWVNPSMIFDPEDHERIVMVWRLPDTVRPIYQLSIFFKRCFFFQKRRDKVGYFWINSTN